MNSFTGKEQEAERYLNNLESAYKRNSFGFCAIASNSQEYQRFRTAMGLTGGGPRRKEISQIGIQVGVETGESDKINERVLRELTSLGWSRFDIDLDLLIEIIKTVDMTRANERSAHIDAMSSQKLLRMIPKSVYQSIRRYLGIRKMWVQKPEILYSESARETTVEELSRKAFLFHRDIDSTASVKIFVNLTETIGGNHEYIQRSSFCSERSVSTKFSSIKRNFHEAFNAETIYETHLHAGRFSKEALVDIYGQSQIVSLPTTKGFAWVEDTYGLHRGNPPISNTRKILVISFLKYPMRI